MSAAEEAALTDYLSAVHTQEVADRMYDWLEYQTAPHSTRFPAAVPHFQLLVQWQVVHQLEGRDALLHLLLHSPGLAQSITQTWVRSVLFGHFPSELTWKDHPLWLRVLEGELRVLLVLRSLHAAASELASQRCTAQQPSLLSPPLPRCGSHQLIDFEGVVVTVEPAKTTKCCTNSTSTHAPPVLIPSLTSAFPSCDRVVCLGCTPERVHTARPSADCSRFFRVPVQLVAIRVASPPTSDADGPAAAQGSRVLRLATTDGLVGRVTLGDRVQGVGEWKVDDAVGYDGESLQCLSDHPFVLVSSLRNVEREPQRSREEVEEVIQSGAGRMAAVKEELAQDIRNGQEMGQRRDVAVTTRGAALSKLCGRLSQLTSKCDLSDVLITAAIVDGFCSEACNPGSNHTLRLHLLLSLCSGGDIDERRLEEDLALGLSPHTKPGAPLPFADDEPRSYRLHVLALSDEHGTQQLVRAAMAYHPHHTELGYTPRTPFHDVVGSGHEHLITTLLPDADVDKRGGWLERMKAALVGHAGLRYAPARTTHSAKTGHKAKAQQKSAVASFASAAFIPVVAPAPSRRLLWWLQRFRGGVLRKGKKGVDAEEVKLLCNGEEAEAMALFDLVSVADFHQADPSRVVMDARAEVRHVGVAGWKAAAAELREQEAEERGPTTLSLMSDLFPSLRRIQEQASDPVRMQKVPRPQRAAPLQPATPLDADPDLVRLLSPLLLSGCRMHVPSVLQ